MRSRPAFARWGLLAVLAANLLVGPGVQAAGGSVQLDDLTWTEVRDALRKGSTTVIIPVGGTEQNGPHMALGKHNFRVAALSARIAATLGNTLVAPVVAYVPQGRISPPAGHMRFPGTISVPQDAFEAVLSGASRSLKQHGFLDIVLIGDSGNYQDNLRDVAQRLNREWAGSRTRVHHIGAYYRATSEEFAQALRSRGMGPARIGTHAGAADTALMLAVAAAHVRPESMRAPVGAEAATGVTGDPAQASAALGRIGVDLAVERAVQAIRQAVANPR